MERESSGLRKSELFYFLNAQKFKQKLNIGDLPKIIWKKFCRLIYCSYLCNVIRTEQLLRVTKLETININITT